MVTTFLEKLAISRRVQQVEEFCNHLDSLFDSGAGEEYLSRLVKASESSATQAAQLKDALITDLKGLLEDMTRQQSEAIAASFQTITQQHVKRSQKAPEPKFKPLNRAVIALPARSRRF